MNSPHHHHHPIRRRKLLVYPSFQLALFFVNTVIMTCAFTGVGLLTAFSFSRMRAHGGSDGASTAQEFLRFLEFQERLVYLHLGVALGLAFLFSWVVTLMVSHKMAGPLVRLRRHFEQLAETGEAPHLDFREDDYFTEFPALVNAAVERLKSDGRKHAHSHAGHRPGLKTAGAAKRRTKRSA
jgi:hypothetical protein